MIPTPEQPKRRGRPAKLDDGRTERLAMRVRPDDKARWQALADAAGLSLSAWIEATLARAKK
jgi:predicted HicB family RNase H-like nuclease